MHEVAHGPISSDHFAGEPHDTAKLHATCFRGDRSLYSFHVSDSVRDACSALIAPISKKRDGMTPKITSNTSTMTKDASSYCRRSSCRRTMRTPPNRSSCMLSLIHISEPTRLLSISYAVF